MSRQPARPTLYKGIAMRSRLEADYARHLDLCWGLPWQYEPRCFASEHGQYLPDFQIDPHVVPRIGWYIEVKSAGLTAGQVDQVLDRMAIVWDSEPAAMLELVLWRYQADRAPMSLMAIGRQPAGDWLVFLNDELHPMWLWSKVKDLWSP